MLDFPQNVKDLFISDNNKSETRKYFKLSFLKNGESSPWFEIENDKIVSETLKVEDSLSSSEDLVFGSCEGAEMQITVADVTQELSGEEFSLSVTVGGNEVPLGVYRVVSYERQSDRRRRKITGYDRMERFNVDVAGWYNSITFPISLKTFRDSLCSYVGVQVNSISLPLDTMQITKTIDPEQISGLEVLQAICEINGCFGHFDRYGKLKFILLQQTGLYPSEDLFPSEDLYPSEFGGDGEPVELIETYKQPMVYEDYLVDGISGLTIRQEEGDVGASVGSGENPYVIEGNFLVYGKNAADLLSVANTIYPYIYGRTYRPASLEINSRPWLEVGDAIIVPTKEDIVETFVMKRTISGCQAMMDKIEATGNKTREEDFSLNKKIIQLEGKTAVIVTTVDEVSATVTDLKQETESNLSILSNQITAEVTRAQEAEAQLSVKADGISLSVENLAENTSTQIQALSQSISLKVNKGNVSSEISLEGGTVTLSGNRLVWNANNSSMSSDGTLTCANAHVSGEINATSGYIGGNEITQEHLEVKAQGGLIVSNMANICMRDADNALKAIIRPYDYGNNPNLTINAMGNETREYGNLYLGAYNTAEVHIGQDTNKSVPFRFWFASGESLVCTDSVTAPNLQYNSSEKIKDDIEPFAANACGIVKNAVIYEYCLKSDKKNGIKRKRCGFVIERETPEGIISEDGESIDLYSAVGILWKAVQELDKKVEAIKN